MLGPGVGALVGRMVQQMTTADDQMVLDELTPNRNFEEQEALT